MNMNTPLARCLLPVLLLLAACAGNPRGTEVTRFHLDKPIEPQAINIEAATTNTQDSLAFSSYSNTVAAELERTGFKPVAGDSANLIAVVGVTRKIQQAAPSRSGFSVGMGGGSFGSSGGVGAGVSMPVGRAQQDGEFVTELQVKLVERDSSTVVWEGTALRATESGGENATLVVQQLATALFQDFPGESGKTVVIK